MTCSAVRFSATSTIGTSTNWPSPVRSRWESAASNATDGVRPGDRVARSSRRHRRPVSEPGPPCHPRELFHGRGEPDTIAPGAVKPERRHPHHDQSPIYCVQLLPSEPELLDDPRREVLDHDVGSLDEQADETEAFGVAQIEGDGPLPDVDPVKDPAVLPPPFVGNPRPPGEPHPVRTPDRLDLHHISTQRAENERR